MIRQEVATAILRELDDPRLEGLLPSVTRVKLAEDLSTADVFVTMMGTPGHSDSMTMTSSDLPRPPPCDAGSFGAP